jgi:hypothetical protein
MKLHHFVLCVLALIPMSFPVVSAIDSQPANASAQTDGRWKQYLGGRKIVRFQRYSSGNGGGGITGKTEIHFCKNGQFVYADSNSFTVNAGNSNINSSGQNGNTGTWKIIESNEKAVAIEAKDNNGQTGKFILIAGEDRKIYSNGNKFFPGPSDVCP